ncbi:blasticidin S deaminase [Bacillus badius]|uniref:Blasticidin S deaminase n=1 Tax=Bacillus badius TaxID=1455 RepID=A0ABR5AZE5_BACBA|nr:blasticidin S deaminase [Bacillus badius]KIL80105.1 blasticidin S deaminase [Bacillus badius]
MEERWNLSMEQQLYNLVKDLIEQRYPHGWGGAAAVRVEDGTVYTSVAPEVINASTELCMETGAILEAHKFKKKVTHSICLARENEQAELKVLSPCGICQERLFYWGPHVQCAITNPKQAVIFKTLQELQPYHWTDAYHDEMAEEWRKR